jgi:hypothetical protein
MIKMVTSKDVLTKELFDKQLIERGLMTSPNKPSEPMHSVTTAHPLHPTCGTVTVTTADGQEISKDLNEPGTKFFPELNSNTTIDMKRFREGEKPIIYDESEEIVEVEDILKILKRKYNRKKNKMARKSRKRNR